MLLRLRRGADAAAAPSFAHDRGVRAVDDVDCAATAGRLAVQPALVIAFGVDTGAGRAPWAGAALLGARLSDLFPPHRARRRHQRAADDVPDSGERNRHGRGAAG